eukprot:gnl/TRDRNA2_/TRDRNA2_164008_c1_seq6.p1 gnl/TRDRNA2_/TRDRNA2_164008_c1~~gnl/TRDRNA2_/TRDRNA2_164008_c1_seq6.p1  ORF type:complete len:665 (-),score=72.68 gnl/TRDRNA2_/TRDRNA2_164008_c1_seq6:18-2012(-)
MCTATLKISMALLMRVSTDELLSNHIEGMGDRLKQALKPLPLRHAALDDSALGKLGHIAANPGHSSVQTQMIWRQAAARLVTVKRVGGQGLPMISEGQKAGSPLGALPRKQSRMSTGYRGRDRDHHSCCVQRYDPDFKGLGWVDEFVDALDFAEEHDDKMASLHILEEGLKGLHGIMLDVEVDRFVQTVIASLYYNAMAMSLISLGGYTEARTCYDKALQLWNGNAMAASNAGKFFLDHGHAHQATEYFQRCLDIALAGVCDDDHAVANKARTHSCFSLRTHVDHPFAVETQEACDKATATGVYMYALQLHRLGRYDEAVVPLQLLGTRLRISTYVWDALRDQHNWKPSQANVSEGPVLRMDTRDNIKVWHEAVPRLLHDSLLEAFAPGANFFWETGYNDLMTDFYSFSYDLSRPPTNTVEHLIQHLKMLLPPTQDGDHFRFAEWWLHSRPVGPGLGHQLHFDFDETSLETTGEVRHPIVSTVVYLSGGSRSGPTIVFNETIESLKRKQAVSNGWLVQPQDGSCLMFSGDLLHGVLPDPVDESQSSDGSGWQSSDPLQRTTLMIGWWTNAPRSRSRDYGSPYGAFCPVPLQSHSCQWPGDVAVELPRDWVPPPPLPAPDGAQLVGPMWEMLGAHSRAMLEDTPFIERLFFLKDRIQLIPKERPW